MYADNNTPRTLSRELKLTEGESIMFQLKAAMYTGGNVEALIKEAVANYIKELKDTCFYCNQEMEVRKETKRYPFKIGDMKKEIQVLNVPTFYCKNCKEFEQSVILGAEIEKIIENRISRGNFEDIDFMQLLKPAQSN